MPSPKPDLLVVFPCAVQLDRETDLVTIKSHISSAIWSLSHAQERALNLSDIISDQLLNHIARLYTHLYAKYA